VENWILVVRLCQGQAVPGYGVLCLSLLERASYLQGASEKMESRRQPFCNLEEESRRDLNQPCLFKPFSFPHSIYGCLPTFGPEILLLIPRFYDIATDG